MNKSNKALVWAYEKGYRVSKDGKRVKGIYKDKMSIYLSSGYPSFGVSPPESIDGKRSVLLRVHRLQAYQKYGDKLFEDGIETRHLDGDKTNNSWDNIAIGTRSQNIHDMPEEKRRQIAIKVGEAQSPLDVEDVIEIRSRVAQGYTHGMFTEMADEYGINASTLINVVKGERWRHIPCLLPNTCNDCVFLSVTEEIQNHIKKETGSAPNHMCNYYQKRVRHVGFEPNIVRLRECERYTKK